MRILNRCIFFIKYDNLLKKYNTIWDKISADIKNQVNSKHVCHIKKF